MASKKVQEDQDVDSGFLSSNTVSDQYSSAFESESLSEVSNSKELEASRDNCESADSNNKKKESHNQTEEDLERIKVREEVEMDSAICDSGMISTHLTNDLSNLSLGREPEQQTKTNENEVYFQINEDGDT